MCERRLIAHIQMVTPAKRHSFYIIYIIYRPWFSAPLIAWLEYISCQLVGRTQTTCYNNTRLNTLTHTHIHTCFCNFVEGDVGDDGRLHRMVALNQLLLNWYYPFVHTKQTQLMYLYTVCIIQTCRNVDCDVFVFLLIVTCRPSCLPKTPVKLPIKLSRVIGFTSCNLIPARLSPINKLALPILKLSDEITFLR